MILCDSIGPVKTLKKGFRTTLKDKKTISKSLTPREGFVKTTPALREKIAELVENNPKVSAGKLWLDLRRLGISPIPSERQLARLKKQFLQRPPESRIVYRYLSWPHSFESGALPWESSGAMLELLRFFRSNGWSSPTMRIAKWFWRITEAAPDSTAAERYGAAFSCAIIEAGGASFEGMQAWLVSAPWRSKKAAHAYLRAVKAGKIPPRRPKGIETSWQFVLETVNQYGFERGKRK